MQGNKGQICAQRYRCAPYRREYQVKGERTLAIDISFHICIEKGYIGMVKMKGNNKDDLVYIFRKLFEKGKISKEELDKCLRLVLECASKS